MPEHSPEATVTYCRNCEATVPLDANYCQNCGKTVSADVAHRDHVDRVIEFFPTFYITFMSIIQAAALGYLLISIKSSVATMLTEGVYNPVIIVQIVATFVLIVMVWQEYMIGISTYRWVPKTPDAIIPFLFALSQGFLIYSIDFQNSAWWFFSGSLVCLVGFLSFFNMYRQARKLPEKNSVVLELAGSTPRVNEIGILSFGAMLLAFGVFELMWKMNSLYLVIVSLVGIAAWMVKSGISWKKFNEI
jgi:hypothetical protein